MSEDQASRRDRTAIAKELSASHARDRQRKALSDGFPGEAAMHAQAATRFEREAASLRKKAARDRRAAK